MYPDLNNSRHKTVADAALAAGNRRPLAGYAAKHFAWSVEAGIGRILREEMTAVGDLTGDDPLLAFTLPSTEKNRLPVEPAAVPLRAIYWLVQAEADSVHTIGLPQQVKHLCSAASIGIRHRTMTVAAIELAERLARRVPVKELHFRLAPDFWWAIDSDLESGV